MSPPRQPPCSTQVFQPQPGAVYLPVQLGESHQIPEAVNRISGYCTRSTDRRRFAGTPTTAQRHRGSRDTLEKDIPVRTSRTHRLTDTPTARSPCEAGQRTATDSEPQKSEETRPLLNRQSNGRVQVPVLYCTVSTRCHCRAGVSYRTSTNGYEFIQRRRDRVVAGVSLNTFMLKW